MNKLTKSECIALELTKAVHMSMERKFTENADFAIVATFKSILKMIKEDPALHD